MVAEPAINCGSADAASRRPTFCLLISGSTTHAVVDLTNWRAAHPAGTHWIDAYDGADATEVMYAFHSDRAMSMMQRLPKSKVYVGRAEAASARTAPRCARSWWPTGGGG